MKELLEVLQPINAREKVELSGVEEKEHYITLKISNTTMNPDGREVLNKNLPGVEFRVNPSFRGIEIQISKINLPRMIPVRDMISHYHEKKLLLGLGYFGLHYFDLEERLSLGIFGNPGMGKSSMLGFLLSQFLSQKIGEHYIVDGKGVDFSPYKKHPNVKGVLLEVPRVFQLLKDVKAEMEERARVFREAFEEPPKNMKEYAELKRKYKRDDLPEFKDIFIWMDEAHKFLPHGYGHYPERNRIEDLLGILLREGRAFGVSVILGTHRSADVSSSVKSLLKRKLLFYQPAYLGSIEGFNLLEGKQRCIRGRMMYFDAEIHEVHSLQTPFFTSKDALAVSFRGEFKGKKKTLKKEVEITQEMDNEIQEN